VVFVSGIFPVDVDPWEQRERERERERETEKESDGIGKLRVSNI
jgi:hypothetical protein